METASPPGLPALLHDVLARRRATDPGRAVLVALSGIDGAGKGFVAARLAQELRREGLGVAVLGADGWLRLPHERFDPARPAEHFYEHALRLEEMFATLVLPLRDRRSVRLEADFAEERARSYRRHLWAFDDVDVCLLEGIFLLKPAFRAHPDLSVWIDCTFETALERALARAQEGLPPEETVRAYRTIYFPAQELHLRRDDPRGNATRVLPNDERLAR